MTSPIILKNSNGVDKAPSVGDLAVGEIAINTVSGDMYTKLSSGIVKQTGGGTNSTRVVTTPAVTGNTSAAIGQNYALSFSATSVLSGGSVTSFTVTKPDGTTQAVTASSNAGSYAWTVAGTAGATATFTVVANDNLGNSSASATFSTALVNVAVNVPSITSPSANATGMLNTFTMSTGQLSLTPATGFTDTHQYTDWEIWTGANGSGTLVWSSRNDATNKTTITVPNTAGLAVSTTYYIAVRHKGTTYGWGGYAYSTF
ncbi:MAG: hypothetical protein ACR2HF_05610, partial [Methylococcaceae bacterium]